jgi:nicotinamide-nucleotide amidase
MVVEIIAIGNEVVDGSILNTNATWLAERLSEEGYEVLFHSAVPDEPALMKDTLARALSRAQVVVVTGGLGPTVDDITMEVAADFFGVPLEADREALEKIRHFFSSTGRELTPNQERQAWLPRGSLALTNGRGTAPGAYRVHQGVYFAFFPGVPSEMQLMFEKGFLPRLRSELQPKTKRYLKVLRCFGLPEGKMDHKLREEVEGQLTAHQVNLGFRVRFPTIDIRLWTQAKSEQEGLRRLKQGEEEVRNQLGKYIFGEGDDSLSEKVGALLFKKKRTLAVAESCTGGLLASEITDVSGASEYFLEGIVTYSNESKQELLGVSPVTLKTHGAVSSEVALEMARGIQKRAGSDYAIGITGIAGPTGGTEEKPVGTVHIAVLHPGGEWEKKFVFPFGREGFKKVAVATGLDRVRRYLLKD